MFLTICNKKVVCIVLVQEHDVLLWELFHHENICSLDGKSESTSIVELNRNVISVKKHYQHRVPVDELRWNMFRMEGTPGYTILWFVLNVGTYVLGMFLCWNILHFGCPLFFQQNMKFRIRRSS